MALDFLTKGQKEQYGNFCGEPNEVQLTRFFHLDETDLELVQQRRGAHNRLGFAILLTSARFLGTFVSDVIRDVPSNVHVYLSKQLAISDISTLDEYSKRETTRREHMLLIRKFYGYKEFNDTGCWLKLCRLLFTRAWLSNERHGLLFDFSTAWLIQHKVILPGVTTLVKLITDIKARCDKRLWKKLSDLPSESEQEKLLSLFELIPNTRVSKFDFYRKGPVTISSVAFNKAIDRYQYFKSFNIERHDFSDIPPVRFKTLARYAGLVSMHKIMRMPKDRKIAVLVAYVASFVVNSLDDALDVFDLLMVDINRQSKLIGIKKRLRTLKDLDKSALYLSSICVQLLEDHTDVKSLTRMVGSKPAKKRLKIAIDTINELARPQNHNYHDEVVEQYSRIRTIMSNFLNHIYFHHTPIGEAVTDSLAYLKMIWPEKKHYLTNAPTEIIDKSWKRLVYDKKDRIKKQGYILCVLSKAQDALRRRDIYVHLSDRWSDPRAKLLQGEQWYNNRVAICRSLGHPVNPEVAIKALSEQLNSSFLKVAANFDKNKAVHIDRSGKQPSLTISNLDKLEEPDSLTILRERIIELIPKVDITELLLEIHQLTGFADQFTHISESKSRADNLHVSICAVLMSEACNVGLGPIENPSKPELTVHRLDWAKQNYIRAETLTLANSLLVDYQSTLWLPNEWGGGEVASADGLRFVTPVKTIHAGPNKKYFGGSWGLTWYNFMSDQYAGFFGVVIPGTIRDSIYLLLGVLEQETSLQPKEIITDTTGTSYLVFGLFWLLGYQFSPRMADAGECKFWRIDKEASYGALDELARGQIKIEKAVAAWDDMLRTAGSLKLGMVSAPELIKSLLKSEKPSSLTQGIIEIGKINATMYLLSYIDDEDYRRRILTQLNRGESRNGLARNICHGKRGEIRQRYQEGQEDQLGALGLVLNAVVLWNTIYMQEAIEYLRVNSDIEIKNEDIARLSPLINDHINMLGHYSFNLSEEILDGELRTLNIKVENELQDP